MSTARRERRGAAERQLLGALLLAAAVALDPSHATAQTGPVLTVRETAGVASVPIQWVLVTFAATVAANDSAAYRLVSDGTAGPNPSPPVSLTLARNGDQVTAWPPVIPSPDA